ncbi:MAG: leucine-rich repeat protein [Bacteroidaceae bacterium]|nr:leucine-rich repeat protein [Bacteroidaceae bacterium]
MKQVVTFLTMLTMFVCMGAGGFAQVHTTQSGTNTLDAATIMSKADAGTLWVALQNHTTAAENYLDKTGCLSESFMADGSTSWQVVPHPDGGYALQNIDGQYITGTERPMAFTSDLSDATRFEPEDANADIANIASGYNSSMAVRWKVLPDKAVWLNTNGASSTVTATFNSGIGNWTCLFTYEVTIRKGYSDRVISAIGNPVASLSELRNEGTYVLFNNGRNAYIYERADNALYQSANCEEGSDASYVFTFEISSASDTEVKANIRSAYGRYLPDVSGYQALSTQASPATYTITMPEDGVFHFTMPSGKELNGNGGVGNGDGATVASWISGDGANGKFTIYKVELSDPPAWMVLERVLTEIQFDGSNYQADVIGGYPQELIDACQETYDQALDIQADLDTYSDEEITQAAENLRAAYEALLAGQIPLDFQSGYYYLVSARIGTSNNMMDKSDDLTNVDAAYANIFSSIALWSEAFDATVFGADAEPQYIWQFEDAGTTDDGKSLYTIKNLAVDQYLNNTTERFTAYGFTASAEEAAKFVVGISPAVPGFITIVNTGITGSVYTGLHTAIDGKYMVNWTPAAGGSAWTVVAVDDETISIMDSKIDSLRNTIAQNALNDTLQKYFTIATNLRDAGSTIHFNGTEDGTFPIGEGLLTNKTQVWVYPADPVENNPAGLFDGVFDGTSFIHTSWHASVLGTEPHFIQMDLGEEVSTLVLKYAVRSNAGTPDIPYTVTLYGTNDESLLSTDTEFVPSAGWKNLGVYTLNWQYPLLDADGNTVSVAMLNSLRSIIPEGEGGGVTSFELPAAYRYVRMAVNSTVQSVKNGSRSNGDGFNYWCLSELRAYAAQYDHSTFYAQLTEADAMEFDNSLAAAAAELKSHAATQATIDRIMAAITLVNPLPYLTSLVVSTEATAGGGLERAITTVSHTESIVTLKVSGPLNGTDINFLHTRLSAVAELDLSEAWIVSGGESYHSYSVATDGTVTAQNDAYQTENDVIGDYMFYNMPALTKICLPSANRIGSYAVAGNSMLDSVAVPEGVREIGEYAFDSNANLSKISLPSTLTAIRQQAFYNNRALTSVSLPENLAEIGMMAFGGTGLTDVTLPESVTTMGDGAFMFCTALGRVHLPESLTEIPYMAFIYCASLNNINTPSSLRTIGESAFQHCSSLKTFELPQTLQSIGDRAFSQSGLTKAVIPDSVVRVGSAAFSSCASLKYVSLGRNQDYSLGESFDYFSGCENLDSLRVFCERPPAITTGDAPSNRANVTLFVPKGSERLYAAAGVWKEFRLLPFVTGDTLADADFAILQAFYNENGGETWAEPWDFTSNSLYFGKWIGVTTKGDRVTGIDLSGMGLSGTLSGSIFGLSELATLDLSNNTLSGRLEEAAADISAPNTSLRFLYLQGNRLEGDVAPLATKLPSLSIFNASYNLLTGVSTAIDTTYMKRVSDDLDLRYQFVDYATKLPIVTEAYPAVRAMLGEPLAWHANSLQTYCHATQQAAGADGFLRLGERVAAADGYTYATSSTSWLSLNGETAYTATNECDAFTGQRDTIYIMDVSRGGRGTQPFAFDWVEGDANIDLTVDVADLQSIIYHVLYQARPASVPFNYTTADANADAAMDVRDCVLAINRILEFEGESAAATRALYNIMYDARNVCTTAGGTLRLTCADEVAALQFTLYGAGVADLSAATVPSGFRLSARQQADGSVRVLLYSLEGATLLSGEHTLLKGLPASTSLGDLRLTDVQGARLPAAVENGATGIDTMTATGSATGEIYDMLGRRVAAGNVADEFRRLPAGVYIIKTADGGEFKVRKNH